MARGKRKASATGGDNGANLGFEAKLWAAADALRNNMAELIQRCDQMLSARLRSC